MYKSEQKRGEYWRSIFAEAMPDFDFRIWPEVGNPEEIKHLVAWLPPESFAQQFPNLEVVFSVGAGVDHFDLSTFPAHLKLVRMLDPQIVQGMSEYVLMATLAIHRQLPSYVQQQEHAEWKSHPWIPASQRRVGLMGIGSIGSSVITPLKSLSFDVNGWSRSEKTIEGVQCFAGEQGLAEFLAETDILVCMLPLTSNTTHILNKELFAQLPKGASIINVGRGQHLVEDDLLVALDSGQLQYAVVDVLNEEPADKSHPFWCHPNIIVTPHIAGVTSFESGGRVLLENIQRYERGESMNGEVKISRGY